MRLSHLLGFLTVAATTAFADVSGTTTLQNNTRFSFDTGNTVASGGDVLWNNNILTPQGSTGIFNLSAFGGSGATTYDGLTRSAVTTVPAGVLSTAPIPSSSLAVDAILLVHTNGGNYAKVLVTSDSGGSLSFQFTTYTSSGGGGGGGGTGGPTITAVENAATNIPPGLPNAPIAQGALFVVKGSNLGPATLAIATTFPLPASIGGTSMKVTVGGTSVDAIMYYALAAQIAAILPSKTPAGTGTLTVTYNNQTSATFPIIVVANNIGVFTLSTTGSGDAVATLPASNTVVSPSNAPNPGEIVTLWATGLGPVTGDETNAAQQADMASVPLKVFIGGQPANVLFRGRNACCSGVDTIYVTVPSGLTGCANSVIMQIGNLVSNATSIPIGTNGRNCVPISQSPTQVSAGTHSFGGLSLLRESITTAAIGSFPGSSTKFDSITGVFERITASSTPPQGSQIDINSYGSCSVSTYTGNQTPATPSTATVTYLDAGNISVTGPGIAGSRQLAKSTPAAGILLYQANLDNTATSFAAGTYTFTGTGGPDVGSFIATYNMPTPFTWTNPSSLGTITRADGATVTWSGGEPAGHVTIGGTNTSYGSTAATSATVSFMCTARVSDGSFTVPPVVLLMLPPSAPASGSNITTPGSLIVTSTGSFASLFQASGIEAGGVGSFFIYGNSATYQ